MATMANMGAWSPPSYLLGGGSGRGGVTLLSLRGREGDDVLGAAAALEGQAAVGRQQHRAGAQHAAHAAWTCMQ